MKLKYIRINEQPKSKTEWINSSLKFSLNSNIKLVKQPYLSKMLGADNVNQNHHQNTDTLLLSKNNFHTRSIFTTNLPTSSNMNFRSKSMIKKRNQLLSHREQHQDNDKNQKMEQNVISWFAPRRSHSEKKIRNSIIRQKEPMNAKQQQTDSQKLKQMIIQGRKIGGRVINVFNIIKIGLKFNLKQSYFILQNQNTKSSSAKDLKDKVKKVLELENKKVYLFHLNREPISRMLEIHCSEYSIFADNSPRLQIPLELYGELNYQIKLLEQKIKDSEQEVPKNKEEEDNIVDIAQYADQLIQNPKAYISIPSKNKKLQINKSDQFTSIIKWYDNGISDFNKKMKESKDNKGTTGLMDQKSNHAVLRQTRIQLQLFPYIINPHKKKLTIQQIRQKQFQMKNKSKSVSKISQYIEDIKSSKEVARQLNNKHSLLSEQNIPYLIQKYNISRSDIHDLYTLYKSLAQISAKRLRSSSKVTLERGIDKNTFNQGLAGIGHNIGKEVIKTVCSFSDYVSWPQFLKIVSISLSKTPQQKLQSILKYVSQDSNNDNLNRLQVDIMVSTCLSKFLGKTQQNDFIQMKQYLLDTIFKQLDPQNEGQISIQVLKNRVLKQGKQKDLISFLFLYSD